MTEFFMSNLREILIYLLIVNVIGFFAMGIDKFKAKNNMWRTKEKTLFTIALVGGSIGAIFGMYTFRHKTKHTSFVVGFPIILIAQITLVCYLIF